MHQVRPPLHHLRSEKTDVPVDPGELGLVHGLNEVAARPARGPLADLLVDVRQLLVGAQPLQHHAPGALPGLAVLGEVHVLDVEDVQEAQAPPRLEGDLAVHELAAPAGAETGGALVEVDEAPVGELVLLEGGEQVVGVHQQDHKQPHHQQQLQAAVQAAQFEGQESQHGGGPGGRGGRAGPLPGWGSERRRDDRLGRWEGGGGGEFGEGLTAAPGRHGVLEGPLKRQAGVGSARPPCAGLWQRPMSHVPRCSRDDGSLESKSEEKEANEKAALRNIQLVITGSK